MCTVESETLGAQSLLGILGMSSDVAREEELVAPLDDNVRISKKNP
jgi:hypothetical protein